VVTRIEFDWDPAKAARNLAKHGVSFDEAMGVFVDPLALTMPDPDSATIEERWITVGLSRATNLLLVVHTHVELDPDHTYIRIISARKPSKREKRQYEQTPQ
jgi:uncharacterized protein